MYIQSRRNILFGGPLLFLFGCDLTPKGATPLQMATTYGNALSDALSASADVLLASPQITAPQRVLIVQVEKDIQKAKEALNAIATAAAPVASDAISYAKTIIDDAKILAPILAPLMGPAALYVDLAISVLQSFVNSLPPPSTAPIVPPAQLRAKARQYKFHKEG